MNTLINNASSTFSSVLGGTPYGTTTSVGPVGWGSVLTFMWGLASQVIGTGLGVLQLLMPYIIALVVIGAIVYFLYRAFRFFRH